MSDDRNDQFSGLMQRVESGSDEAIRELLETYGSHILRTIRRRLNRQLRSQFDSYDFYQAVWASFFTHENRPKFQTEDDLIMFLSRVAGNKVIDECRRQLGTQKRDLRQECSLFDSQMQQDRPVKANVPTPSEVLVAREQIDKMTEGRPEHYRKILELRTSGATVQEISNETGIHKKTVHRVLKRLGDRAVP